MKIYTEARRLSGSARGSRRVHIPPARTGLLFALALVLMMSTFTVAPAFGSGLAPEFLSQFGEPSEGCRGEAGNQKLYRGECAEGGESVNPVGVATDSDTGHVFTAESNGNRISEFTAWGSFVKTWGWGVVASGPDNKPKNEIQELSVDATGGSFRINYSNPVTYAETGPIAFNATAAAVQSAFDGLTNLKPGDVAVSGPSGGPWTIEFNDVDVPPIETFGSTLSGGTASTTVKTIQQGGNFEVCVPANGDICRVGQSGARFEEPSGRAGQFSNPQAVAVDSNGDVYVEDKDNHRVQKFDSEGNFLLMFGGEVDKGPNHPGNLCTAAYISAGDNCGAGTTGTANGQFSAWPFSGGISVGPGDVVYVGDKERIQEFNSDGTYKSQIALPAGKTASLVAVAPSGNIFYSTTNFQAQYIHQPIHQIDSAGAPICTVPVGNPLSLATDPDGNVYFFAASVYEDHVQPDEGEAEEDDASEIREYDSSCEPITSFANREFIVGALTSEGPRGMATNPNGDLYVANAGQIGSFIRAYGPAPIVYGSPPSIAPVFGPQFTTKVGTTTASLGAQINPRFWPDTTYYAQYGEADCATSSCTDQPASPGTLLTESSTNGLLPTAPVELTGLDPGTTYHYRFVSESGGGGPVFGPDRTFRTYEDTAAGLPDERAYEMVSPLEKEGGEVGVPSTASGIAVFSVEPLQASPSGDAMSYGSFAAFGKDPKSAPATGQYLSRRGEGGWSTDNINPRFEEGYLRDPVVGFSEDLSHAGVIAIEPELTEDAAIDVPNIYQRDNASGALTALTTEAHHPQTSPSITYCVFYGGTSADSKRTIFGAAGGLLPGDPVAEGFNLYEWSPEGGLALLSVLPDESKATPSVQTSFGLGHFEGGLRNCNPSETLMRHAISADGSRIFWTYGGEIGTIRQPLLARVDGAKTIQLDAPNEGVSGKGGEGQYWDASTDGSKVFFTDPKKLTATPTTAGSADLYRYDFDAPEGERLTDLSAHVGEAAGVRGVIGASEDGSYVYFTATGVLTGTEENANHEKAQSGDPNLYAWHAGDGVRYVATLSAEDASDWSDQPTSQSGRVSPDGSALAFLSHGRLTGFDNEILGGHCQLQPGQEALLVGGPKCAEAFLYDYQEDTLRCASCNPAGTKPLGRATLPAWSTPYEQPRYLSTGGKRLFFETIDSLDPNDTDQKQDVYEFELPGTGSCTAQSTSFNPAAGGCDYLISTGSSDDESYFLDASTSGDDAFVSTRQGLVFNDEDGRYDVYDARVGGSSPQPPPPECEGEGCRGRVTSGPSSSPGGTTSFQGPGNPVPKRGCPKGRREMRKGGKARCVKAKAKKHQKRSANHKRRTNR